MKAMTDSDTDRSHTAAPALIGALLHLAATDAGLAPTATSALSPKDSEILAEVEVAYAGEFGRLRDVVSGPEGEIWLLTNNTDGRGDPAADDDRILHIPADFSTDD